MQINGESDINQYVGIQTASEMVSMKPGHLYYYVLKGRGPESIIVDGRRMFKIESLNVWKPHKLKRGRKPVLP